MPAPRVPPALRLARPRPLPRCSATHFLRSSSSTSASHPEASTSGASDATSGVGGPSTGPSSSGQSDSTTHFGFREVPSASKESLVGQVFSSVASSYDLMNDAMSLGIHRLWKDHFVRSLDPHSRSPSAPFRSLDVAGGTGDIALRILDYARERYGDRDIQVQVVDINPDMLGEGMARFKKTMYHDGPQIAFSLGNAQSLVDIPSDSVDLYTIAFGIRNCTDVQKVLEEAHRVLKKGGTFACLEFSKVDNPLLSKLYEAYSFNVIPNLGHILASDRDSYQYLVESIQRFPSQPQFASMIQKAGFALPHRDGNRPTPGGGKGWEDLTFGVAAIHTGVKV